MIDDRKKTVLCDIPNTLFDSRHRTLESGVCAVGITSDEINYSVLALVKAFKDAGYQVIYTHYLLQRLRRHIENKLIKHRLPKSYLITNIQTQEVYSNETLKKYLVDKYSNIEMVIDNDESLKTYWMSKDVGLIQVPLPIIYKKNMD